MNVIVFGASGMLGHTVADFLYQHRQEYEELTFTARSDKWDKFQSRWSEAKVVGFDVMVDALLPYLHNNDYAINCIGLINKLIDETDGFSWLYAKAINAEFPKQLAALAADTKTKILHISTDCVFSGLRGGYDETDKPDATDAYGRSKSEGEIEDENVRIVRCSVVGPELETKYGVLEWFLSQKGKVNGFANHYWNGITTLAFAQLCHTVMINNFDLPHLHHFIPYDPISKAVLLKAFADIYHRNDIEINFTNAPETIDRTLRTINPLLNEQLWRLMGYVGAPTIKRLVEEMKEWKRF